MAVLHFFLVNSPLIYILFSMVTRIRQITKTKKEPFLCRLRLTPLGYCLRVIKNKTHTNLEKTTSSVLSVILINIWLQNAPKALFRLIQCSFQQNCGLYVSLILAYNIYQRFIRNSRVRNLFQNWNHIPDQCRKM